MRGRTLCPAQELSAFAYLEKALSIVRLRSRGLAVALDDVRDCLPCELSFKLSFLGLLWCRLSAFLRLEVLCRKNCLPFSRHFEVELHRCSGILVRVMFPALDFFAQDLGGESLETQSTTLFRKPNRLFQQATETGISDGMLWMAEEQNIEVILHRVADKKPVLNRFVWTPLRQIYSAMEAQNG